MSASVISIIKLRVFHGGNMDDPNVPPVTYWTPDKKIAQTYADKTDTGKLYQKYLALKNPAPAEKVKHKALELGIHHDDSIPARSFDQRIHGPGAVQILTESLAEDGHDGAVLPDVGHETNAEALAYVEFNKSTPTSQQVHVNRPIGEVGAGQSGKKRIKEKDDPGTEDVDTPEVMYFADVPTILNPKDARVNWISGMRFKSAGVRKLAHFVAKADKVVLDVPLFLRLLEVAREDIKEDNELHLIAERAIGLMNSDGPLTMEDYSAIVRDIAKSIKDEEKEDDPGTQDLSVEPTDITAAPDWGEGFPPFIVRPQRSIEQRDDPGTQDVDPPEEIEAAPNNADSTIAPNELITGPPAWNITKKISGSSQIGINVKGKVLAAKLAQRLAVKGSLDIGYCSDLKRGIQTLDIIHEANPHMTVAQPTAALEPWKLGAFEGKGGDAIGDHIVYYIEHPDERPAGNGKDGAVAETFKESEARQLKFWKKLYDDFAADPTLKIGVVCHGRGLDLLMAAVDAGFPEEGYKLDEKDLIQPEEVEHAAMMRWHKDEIEEVDLEFDDPFKSGIYPILHSLTDDDKDDGNEQLEKAVKYLPPTEVLQAAKVAYDAGSAVLDITYPLSEGEGLTVDKVQEIAKHFEASASNTESELARNAWGGSFAAKWAQRVLRKVQKDAEFKYPPWIAVDLDNTLAQELPHEDGFDGTKIGPPIPKMLAKVKQALKDGKAVRIWTARVAHDPEGKVRTAIEQWCKEYVGQKLPVTNEKDPGVTEIWDDKAHNASEINKDGHSNGVMICFRIDPAVAQQLALQDGETPESMHVTLLYLGKLPNLPMEKLGALEKKLAVFAQKYAPVSGDIAGPIRFAACANTEGRDVAVASFDTPSIQEFRKELLKLAESCGFEIGKKFSYTPHITLKYIQTSEPMPVQRIAPIPVTFSKIVFSVGGANKEFVLAGTTVAKGSGSHEGTWVTVNGQHVLIGADGKPMAGNPKAYGREVSTKVERARGSAVLTGQQEQAIADKAEEKLSKAIGIPRTRNNSAFDLKSDEVGVEVKTLIHGKNEKLTMSKTALARKVGEQRDEELRGYTVAVDMRGGRQQAAYYYKVGFGSFRLGSMTRVSLADLKTIVKG